MKRISFRFLLKLFAGLVASVLLAVSARIAWFDCREVAPLVREARAKLATVDPEDRNPPALFRELLAIDLTPTQQASWAWRQALWAIVGREPVGTRRFPYRQFRELFSVFVLRVRLGEDELAALICAGAWNGKSHGCNRLALDLFGRPLSALDRGEVATILAVLRSPNRMRNDVARRERLRDAILAKAAAPSTGTSAR